MEGFREGLGKVLGRGWRGGWGGFGEGLALHTSRTLFEKPMNLGVQSSSIFL